MIWFARLDIRGKIRPFVLISREEGRQSHETEPSWRRRGGPVVQSVVGSRAARPTRRRVRRHSSSRLGRDSEVLAVKARGRPDALSAMDILSRFASSCRRYSGSRGSPLVCSWNVSAIVVIKST